MKKINLTVLTVFLMAILVSCGNGNKTDADKLMVKPGSSGKTYEMLVVCNDAVWDSSIGANIRDFFHQYDSTLNQTEQLYFTPHITNVTYEKNSMFQNHRNVMIIKVDPTNDPKIEKVINKHSQPQRIFRITVRNEKEFETLFTEYKQEIYNTYVEAERIRLNRFFGPQSDRKMAGFLTKKFNLSLDIPKGFSVAKESADFVWLWRKTAKVDYGIMVYVEPYVDTMQLDFRSIIQRRDMNTFEFIPGDLPGSYMEVTKDFPVASYPISFNGNYAVESRGLWETHGDFMGGPFLHYTIVDEKYNRLIHLDGFLYAPGEYKRDELMQVEAMLYTLKIHSPKEAEE